MRHFAQNRPTVMRTLLNTRYSLGGTYTLTLPATEGGHVRVNTITVPGSTTWTGVYFRNLDLNLVAEPDEGYEFVRWEGMAEDRPTVTMRPASDLTVRPVFAQISSVERSDAMPAAIELHPAFPNPFNPTTVLRFRVATAAETQDLASLRVRMTVHDMLGRRVATLVDGVMPAGTHSVRFDASGLPSGVYLVRLEAGGEVMTSKVTLLK